jgi:uncharacterized membrane protein
MKARWTAAILALGVIIAFAGGAKAAGNHLGYTFTSVDFPNGSDTDLVGINQSGRIVGGYGPNLRGPFGVANHGLLIDGQSFTSFDFPGAMWTEATGINAGGNITGLYRDTGGIFHGFLLADQAFTSVDFPGALQTELIRTNSRGDGVGFYDDSARLSHGFKLAGGNFTSIDFPGAPQTECTAINDEGTIVGGFFRGEGSTLEFHGFQLKDGNFMQIDVPAAGTCSGIIGHFERCATAVGDINDMGQMTGWFTDSSAQPHGFVATDGVFETVEVPFPSAVYTQALGINNSGDVVGRYLDSAGVLHGFVAKPVHGAL